MLLFLALLAPINADADKLFVQHRSFTLKEPYVQGLAASHDGKLFAAGGWSATTKEIPKQVGGERVIRMQSTYKTRIVVQAFDDPKERAAFTAQEGQILALAFSRDDKRLVSASYQDNAIVVYDLKTAREQGRIRTTATVSLAVSDTQVAGGGDDGRIQVWDFKTLKEVNSVKPHDGRVASLAFASAGKLHAGSFDKTLSTIYLKTNEWKRQDLPNVAHAVRCSGEESVHVFGTKYVTAGNAKLVTKTLEEPENVRVQTMSPDGTMVAYGMEDGGVFVRALKTGMESTLPKTHQGTVSSLAFSPDGKHLISGDDKGVVVVWKRAR
jgi:WD40 repeat protein